MPRDPAPEPPPRWTGAQAAARLPGPGHRGVPALPAGHCPAQGLSKGLDPSKDVSAWPTAESVPGNLRIRLCGSDSETPPQGPQWLRMNSHCPPRPGALSPEVGGRALLRRHCPAPLVSRLGLCPQPRPVRVTGIFRWREFPAGGFGVRARGVLARPPLLVDWGTPAVRAPSTGAR